MAGSEELMREGNEAGGNSRGLKNQRHPRPDRERQEKTRGNRGPYQPPRDPARFYGFIPGHGQLRWVSTRLDIQGRRLVHVSIIGVG